MATTSLNKKVFAVIILNLIAFIFIYKINNIDSIDNSKLFEFPKTFLNHEGVDVPMEDWVYKSLETPYAILRNYITPEKNYINLAIVWYDDRDIAFHAPEACLGGTGNTVKREKFINVIGHDNIKYTLGELYVEKGNKKQLVYYYYINEGNVTPNQISLRKNIIKQKLMLKRTSAAFVRIMTSINVSEEEAGKRLSNFFKITIRKVNKYTATRYIL